MHKWKLSEPIFAEAFDENDEWVKTIFAEEIERRINEYDGLRKLLNINAYDDKTIDEWLRENE